MSKSNKSRKKINSEHDSRLLLPKKKQSAFSKNWHRFVAWFLGEETYQSSGKKVKRHTDQTAVQEPRTVTSDVSASRLAKEEAARKAAEARAEEAARAAEEAAKAAEEAAKAAEKAQPTVIHHVVKHVETRLVNPEPQPAPKKKETKPVEKYPQITSMKSLQVLAKNTAEGADDAYRNTEKLLEEIGELTDKISKLRAPAGSDDSVKAEIAEQRAALRKEKSAKINELELADAKGKHLEVNADEYAYLLKCFTGNRVDFRKTPRFNEEVVIRVSDEDVAALRARLFS